MAIVSFAQTRLTAGTIGTSQSFSKQQNFGASTVWSSPYLQMVSINDDDADVELSISQFKDSSGTHNGNFRPGIFATNCTSVTFAMSTRDCIATAALTTMIFG